MPEWSGIVHTHTKKFLKGAEDHTLRNRLLFGMLDEKGRLTYNNKGLSVQWQVEYREVPVTSFADGSVIQYSRQDKWQNAEVDWRGYNTTDAYTLKEGAISGGATELVNRYAQIVPGLEKSMRNKLGLECYIDGLASGNQDRFMGLETFLGAGTVTAADKIAAPSDTYAGLSTVPATLGGTWSADLSTSPNASLATDWPEGTGDPEYDYFSPKLVNYSSTAWGTGSTTWQDNCELALRQARDWSVVNGGAEGVADVFLLAVGLFTQFKNKFSGKERVVVDTGSPLRKYGARDVMNLDGVDITSEYGVPAGLGYGLNFDEMTLRFCESQMFMPKGPDYAPQNGSWVFLVYTFGNFTFNPKAFVKLKAYA